MKKEKIIIFDTTLRDGEQSPGATLNHQEKMIIANQLAKLGVDVIEAGFPAASHGDFKAVKEVGETIKGLKVAALARCLERDIDSAAAALKNAKNPRMHVFLATSPIHMKYKLKKSPKEIIELGVQGVKRAKDNFEDVEFSPEDASRTKPKFLFEILEKVIDAGATTVNIPDTVGYAQPYEFAMLIKSIKENVPNIDDATISVHCHNDLGLAVANSLEAVRNGARQVECTINGIGERAGNASLEEIVMSLHTRKDHFGYSTNIKTREIYKTSRMVSDFTGLMVQPNKAIVGRNAFAHEAGIHQHGMLSKRECYEIMDPKMIGLKTELVIGKHSGKHAVKKVLNELGYRLTKEQLAQISAKIKSLADKQKHVFREDILAIANDVTQQLTKEERIIELDELIVVTGNKIKPTATVNLIVDGKAIAGMGKGVGPVDAVNKAISSVVGNGVTLKEYGLKAITGGTDALAEVAIKVEDGKKNVYSAGAINEDVIMASAKALIKGANKVLNFERNLKRKRGKVK
ncbi:MAG: 2-isopropylmalate synthase [Candidatus Diapherotrites archaeon]